MTENPEKTEGAPLSRPGRPVTRCECGDHCFASLTSGFVTLTSVEDAGLLNTAKWWASRKKFSVYAKRACGDTTQSLHRAILRTATGNVVDHINGNGLDNRRQNLREATKPQNSINRLNRKIPKSGFFGVTQNRKRWVASIRKETGFVYIGIFKEAEDAARARDAVVFKEYGEFAVLNFPEEFKSIPAAGGNNEG